MGLEIPKIDDTTFAKLVEEAIKRISQHTKEWTDYNLHDPGITFIELLAWLTEMQIFYLDQITDQHKRKFLKLLGVEPRPTVPSRVQVTFSLSDKNPVSVGAHAALEAKIGEETIPFETIDSLCVVPASLEKVVVDEGNEKPPKHFEPNYMQADADNIIYAFGETPTEKAAFHLGFSDGFPENVEICLAINLVESDLAPKGEHDEEPNVIPSANTLWEYLRNGSWLKLDVTSDSTLALSQSGLIKFRFPSAPTESNVEGEKSFWLRCQPQKAAYEIPPRIKSIRLNTVEAIQMKRLEGLKPDNITTLPPDSMTALPNQVFRLERPPIVPRRFVLRVKEDEKWREWKLVENFDDSNEEDEHYRIRYETNEIEFGDKKRGRIPPKDVNNIKVTSYILEEPAEKETLSSTGEKNQVLLLGKVPPVSKDILLRVGKGNDEEKEVWSEVPDFDSSKPTDRHFTLNLATGEVQFGTGCRGQIRPDAKLEATNYYCTRGEGGNVGKETITEIVDQLGAYSSLKVVNYEDAKGGKNAEDLDEAIVRIRRDLKKPYRAVTLDDFEYHAKATPGLRVARSKAVRNDDLVTVIVVPYTLPNEEGIPKGASEGFKKTVCMHLDRHRILTTRMEVIDPEYVVVSVHATVKIKPLASASDVSKRIVAELKTFFDPLQGYGGSGWPFGRNVYRSEVCAKIESIEGVDCIQSLNILAEGNFTYKDGNVTIGKTSLVRSGKHSIEIVEAQEPCKSGWQ